MMKSEIDEIYVIDSLCQSPELRQKYRGILNPDIFYHASYRIIYNTLLEMDVKGLPITVESLTLELSRDSKVYEQVGGFCKIAERWKVPPLPDFSINEKINILEDLWYKRQLTLLNIELEEILKSEKDSNEIINQINNKLIFLQRAQKDEHILQLDEKKWWKWYERLLDGNKKGGIDSGYIEMDEILGRLTEKELIIVGGFTSHGKTTFLLNILRNITKCGRCVAYISLEQSQQSIQSRLISREAKIDLNKIRKQFNLNKDELSILTFEEQHQIETAINRLEKERIILCDCVGFNFKQIEGIISKVVMMGAEVIMIDHLTHIARVGGAINREMETADIVRNCKRLAILWDIPIILASQLNRDAKDRKNKEPILSDLRDSGIIEQVGDVVILLYSPDETSLKVIVAKNREGTTGNFTLGFEKNYNSLISKGIKPKKCLF